jgi:hypothetical protein
MWPWFLRKRLIQPHYRRSTPLPEVTLMQYMHVVQFVAS